MAFSYLELQEQALIEREFTMESLLENGVEFDRLIGVLLSMYQIGESCSFTR